MSISPDIITAPRDPINSPRVIINSSRDVTTPPSPSHTQELISGLSISVQRPDRDLHPLQTKERFIQRRRHTVCTTLEEFTSQGFVPFLPEGLLKKGGAPPTPATVSRAVPASVLRRNSDLVSSTRGRDVTNNGAAASFREENGTARNGPLVKKVSIGSQASSSGGDESPVVQRRKRFTDEEIDLLSYLYSNNFDPTKKAPDTVKDSDNQTNKDTDIQPSRQPDKQSSRQPDKQSNRQPDKQSSRHEILAERLGVKDIGMLLEEESDGSAKSSRSDSHLPASSGRRFSSVNWLYLLEIVL